MIDELEGELFTINHEEWIYNTINYGMLYDWDNKKDNYFLKVLITDETEQTIWFGKIYVGIFDDEEFEKPDKKYYPKPGREMIMRIFEYKWVQ